MKVQYIQLKPESTLPDISELNLFRCVVVIDEIVKSEWQAKVSDWLVKSGCLYMMAWGEDCSSWDDSVDYANLQIYNYEEVPEDKFVMTTWHEDEPLKEVFWFSKNNAFHSTIEIENTLILHISSSNKEREYLAEYTSA